MERLLYALDARSENTTENIFIRFYLKETILLGAATLSSLCNTLSMICAYDFLCYDLGASIHRLYLLGFRVLEEIRMYLGWSMDRLLHAWEGVLNPV